MKSNSKLDRKKIQNSKGIWLTNRERRKQWKQIWQGKFKQHQARLRKHL